MERVKFAIVGCGSVSGNRYFPRLGDLSRGQLTAVCDAVVERARNRAEQFGVPYYGDFNELLEKGHFDLLVNLTSDQMHFSLNLQAIQAGKHVYTQKPMTGSVAEATILIEEAKQRGVKLVAEEACPLFPYNLAIRRLLQEDVLGKVVWARSRSTHRGAAMGDNWPTDPSWHYKKGSGPARCIGIERIQLLTSLLGPVCRVSAMSGINQPVVVVRSGPAKGTAVEVDEDDVTLITMDFGESIFAMLDCAWIAPPSVSRMPDLEIYGSKGIISSIGGGPKNKPHTLELYRDDPELGIRGSMDVELIPSGPAVPPQVLGLAHALDCIYEDKQPILTGGNARHAIEVLEKTFVAARTGVTQTLETTLEPIEYPEIAVSMA